MFEHVVKYLHDKDNSVLLGLVYHQNGETDISGYFSGNPSGFRTPLKVDDGIYVEKHNNTAAKISILRKLFALFHEGPTDLVFYLHDQDDDTLTDRTRHELNRAYWEYALPVVQEANRENGCFDNRKPSDWRSIAGTFGISGFAVNCVANQDEARVELYLGKQDAEANRRMFDFLQSRSKGIEDMLEGTQLTWNRLGGSKTSKASLISTSLEGVALANEADWPRMAEFMATWSRKFLDVFVPILKESSSGR